MPETDTIPVSASTATAGKGLRYIGNHVAAWSGMLPANNNEVTHLEFTTGNHYIIADISCTGSIKEADIPDGDHSIFIIRMNDEKFGTWKVTTITEGMPTTETIPLLIPPHTSFKITCDSYNPGADYFTAVTLVGRVYGAV